MAKQLAFMTYGRLLEPFGHVAVQGFVDRVPSVYAAADQMPGFVARSERSLETYEHSWGPIEAPDCWCGIVDDRIASTLSIWEDIESVAAYAYHGAHGEAMKFRKDWFEHNGLPEQVAWWLEDGEIPTWKNAAERMDLLHANGPTAQAFNLKQPFDSDGKPYKIDTIKVREKAELAKS